MVRLPSRPCVVLCVILLQNKDLQHLKSHKHRKIWAKTGKIRFAQNLKFAINRKKSDMGKLADALGWDTTGYEWLRRISTQGLGRVTKKKRKDLEQLCRLVDVAVVDWLWVEPANFKKLLPPIVPKSRYFTVADFRTVTYETSPYLIAHMAASKRFPLSGLDHDELVKQVAAAGLNNRGWRDDPWGITEATQLVAWFHDANDLTDTLPASEWGVLIDLAHEIALKTPPPTYYRAGDPLPVDGLRMWWRNGNVVYVGHLEHRPEELPTYIADSNDPLYRHYFADDDEITPEEWELFSITETPKIDFRRKEWQDSWIEVED